LYVLPIANRTEGDDGAILDMFLPRQDSHVRSGRSHKDGASVLSIVAWKFPKKSELNSRLSQWKQQLQVMHGVTP
jgi:hypothetical protein